MPKPELSVVIPTFGRARETARAVTSALCQEDVAIEVIVVDDASLQAPVLGISDERLRVLRLDRNGGPAAARNAGVASSRAGWIALLDSDDVWPARSLRPRLDAARSAADPDRAIWCAGFVDVRLDGSRGRIRVPRASARPLDFASGCWSCPGSTALMSRAAWARSGGQDENLRRLEDYEWLFRWGLSGGELRTNTALGAEISRAGRAPADVVERAAAAILAKHADAPDALKQRMKSYLALEIGAARLHAGDAFAAAAALAHSWLLRPRLRPAIEPFWTREIGG